jgi:uncharacterized membrane protein
MERFQKTRIEAFSDGVFAIIITLLVLEINVPEIDMHNSANQLTQALIHLFPKFLSWVISFLMIAVIWVNHHRILESVKLIDRKFFWLNINLLLWTSFIPFPTALLGDYADNKMAASFFGIVLSFTAIAFVLLRLHLVRNPALRHEAVSEISAKRALKRSVVFGPLLYWLGASMAWIIPVLAWCIYLLIPFFFIFPKLKSTHE